MGKLKRNVSRLDVNDAEDQSFEWLGKVEKKSISIARLKHVNELVIPLPHVEKKSISIARLKLPAC